MKVIVFACLAIGLLNAVKADDDGKYRPEVYDNFSGKYSATNDGRYYNNYNGYVGRNKGYYPNYSYQPQYYNTRRPYQELLAPLASQKATSALPVAVPSTVAPAVVSTAKYIYTKNDYANEGYARIIEQENDINENTYQYKYRTENGISAAESGIVDTANPQGGTRVQGFYEYVGDDGLTYRVDYVADENGFRATGAHLPKA